MESCDKSYYGLGSSYLIAGRLSLINRQELIRWRQREHRHRRGTNIAEDGLPGSIHVHGPGTIGRLAAHQHVGQRRKELCPITSAQLRHGLATIIGAVEEL